MQANINFSRENVSCVSMSVLVCVCWFPDYLMVCSPVLLFLTRYATYLRVCLQIFQHLDIPDQIEYRKQMVPIFYIIYAFSLLQLRLPFDGTAS